MCYILYCEGHACSYIITSYIAIIFNDLQLRTPILNQSPGHLVSIQPKAYLATILMKCLVGM